MSTADKLNKVLETKEAIKQAIIDKGGTVGDVFAEYPTAIQNIQGGGGSGTFVVPAEMRFGQSKFTEFPEDWDWSEIEKVTKPNNLFYYCEQLEEIPKLKFKDLQSGANMFNYCSKVTDIDTSEWNMSNLTDTQYMFNKTYITTNPPLNTSKATTMQNMFANCTNLTEIKDLDTSSATRIDSMFNGCSKLQTVSELDCSKLTSDSSSYSSPFSGCFMLRNFEGLKNIKVNMYLDKCYSLSYESLMNVINKLTDGVSGKTLYLHQDCVNQLSDDDIAIATNKGWSISPARTITEPVVVTKLSQIPNSTYQITPKTYDFSQFNGVWGTSSNSSITNRGLYVFEGDLSNTTDASYMFKNCQKLSYVTLTNTQNIVSMTGMFWSVPIKTAPELDTSNVTNMDNMFYDTDITNVPNYNTSNVTSMRYMFYQCFYLKTADLSGWDLSKVEDISQMFGLCPKLTSIKMTGDVSNIINVSSFVSSSVSGTFYYDPAYDYSKIIAALPATWIAVPITE